jgi:alpha-ribazole phosphatase
LPVNARAVCSPARRTRETAERLGLVALEEPAFREQDFGAWTGRRHTEIERELGPAYRAFWKSPASNRPPGGESFVDQIARASAGLALLPEGHAILVVHSGTIRAVLAIALDLKPEQALRFVIDPLSLTRIDRLAEGWRVVAVNQRPEN